MNSVIKNMTRSTRIMRVLASCLLLTFFLTILFPTGQVYAAVSDWHQGANIYPSNSNTDFNSDNFKQSLRNLVADGANSVSLIVPYYQSNIYSTDIQRGWNTPTDDSLLAGIKYAKSLGLRVMVTFHLNSWDGNWRANINPSDRSTWFTNYGINLVHTAQIAQQGGADVLSIGTEMVSMAADNMNSSNTQNWASLINKVKNVYMGKLVYGANATSGNDDPFTNEKKFIKFWNLVDYVGISAYYDLGWDNSVNGIKNSWNNINNNDIQGFAASVNGKPIMMTEIGYRSIDNAQQNPWDYSRGSAPNQQAQANAYEALFSYWNNYNTIQGSYIWDWRVDPNAGGANNTDYTPQNKQAEQVIKNWYTTGQPVSTSTNNGGTPVQIYGVTGRNTSSNTTAGQTQILHIDVQNNTQANQNVLVDIEVYDSANRQVMQFSRDNQSYNVNESKGYDVSFTPVSADTYRVAVGIFAPGWSSLYSWSNSVFTFTISGSSGGTGGNNGGSTGGTSTSTATTTPVDQGGNQSSTSTSATSTATSTNNTGGNNGGSTGGSTGSMSSATLEIWWPTNGASVNGLQPFKIMLQGFSLDQYDAYWQVDNGGLVPMFDTAQDYPHKEALVDLSGWKWKGNGPYHVNFVIKDKSGNIVNQKAVDIMVY